MGNKKWVGIWGAPPSVMGYSEARYAKDITFRYKIHTSISGDSIRIRFSNWNGKAPVTLSNINIAAICGEGLEIDTASAVKVTVGGKDSVTLPAGGDCYSDEIPCNVVAGTDMALSFYLPEFTDMSSGVNQSGPFVGVRFSQGNCALSAQLPIDKTNDTGNLYFVETIECLTTDTASATILFGDSITAMGWPDYLAQRIEEAGIERSVIRRGVSGSRVLREYDCTVYAGYGLKGQTRFPREIEVAGADSVIILHGVNDLIHPDGSSVFRPREHFPSAHDMIEGFKFYIETAHEKGLKVYLATIMPFGSWRTFEPYREEVRCAVNEWMRNEADADGVVDLAKALEDPNDIASLLPQYDCGDHLHPSDLGSRTMAQTVPMEFLK